MHNKEPASHSWTLGLLTSFNPRHRISVGSAHGYVSQCGRGQGKWVTSRPKALFLRSLVELKRPERSILALLYNGGNWGKRKEKKLISQQDKYLVNISSHVMVQNSYLNKQTNVLNSIKRRWQSLVNC